MSVYCAYVGLVACRNMMSDTHMYRCIYILLIPVKPHNLKGKGIRMAYRIYNTPSVIIY